MPQFQLDNFLPQLAWLALFFIILYFGVVKLTLPKVGRVIDEREQTVDSDLSTAEAARADAERIRAEYAEGIAQAQAQAQGQVTEAKAKVGKKIEKKLAKVNAELDEKLVAAQAAIAASRDSAMAEVERIAGEAAAEIVERLTGAKPTEADLAKALAAATGRAA